MTRQLSPLASAVAMFRRQKELAEGAIGQLDDEQLRRAIAPGTNSVAVIMKHMAGNMRSRWSDFLTSDGEKPDRDRESEFVDDFASRGALDGHWESGWRCLFDALAPLTDADLARTVTIRGEPHSVIHAIDRQLDHYGYHVGQIVLIAKILCGERWQSLSIPPGDSAAFNRKMEAEWERR